VKINHVDGVLYVWTRYIGSIVHVVTSQFFMRSIAIPNYRLEIRKQFPQKKIRVRGALRQGGKRSEARASSIYTRKEKSTWPLSMQAVYTSKLMVLGLAWHPASNTIISVDDVLYTWQSYFSDNESTTWLWLVTRASRESIHVVALASRSSAQASEADAQVLER
jgi:hypothetical protein